MATSSIKGLSALEKKLKALPPAALEAIRGAMEQSANEIVSMAKSLVPTRTGALRDSISWTYGDPPKGSMVLGRVTGRRATARRSKVNAGLVITVYAGNSDAFWARWVEFGTVNMSAQPYFYPSYRANKKRLKSRVNRALKKSALEVAKGRIKDV